MNWPTNLAEFSHSSLSPSTFLEQPSSLNSGLTDNRENTDEIWQEIAQRFNEIIEKDIKLRNSSQPMANSYLYTSLQTGRRTTAVENPQGNCLPILAKPVEDVKERIQAFVERQNEKKQAETFPKIVKVFSLNPSLPVQIFRDHVTLMVTPNEIAAQPVGGKALQNKSCAETEKEAFYNDRSTKYKGGDILTEYDKTSVMQDFKSIDKQKIPRGTNCRMYQHIFVTDHIDTSRISDKEAQNSSRSKVNSVDEWLHISSDCMSEDHSSEGICAANLEVSPRKEDVLEQTFSDVNAEKKRKRRKRRAIFGPKKTERYKKRCLGNLYYVKDKDQNLLDEERTSNTVNDKCFQFECFSSFSDTEKNNMDKGTTEMRERGKNNENQSQDYVQDVNIPLKVHDEENITDPLLEQTEVTSTNSAQSNDESGSSPSITIYPFYGNDTRQNKIIFLKEKLAKQEQELQNLKRRKDFEVVEQEDLQHYAEQESGEPMEVNVREFPEADAVFDLNHQKDIMFLGRDNEIQEDLDLGKIEDLKHIFQNVIKSFSSVLDSTLYSTRIVPTYARLQTNNYAVNGNYRGLLPGIDNQMMPEDFASKEEFLLQLGLLRI